MGRPLVGVNCKLVREDGDTYWKLDRAYADAIRSAGAEPLILPFVRTRDDARAWLDRVDGVCFTGGADINPRRWGERRHPNTKLLHPEKEKSDFLFAEEALERDLPVLAICLGCQLVNVALGGTVLQHIGNGHRDATHPVELRTSKLRDILGARRIRVNSYHHQAVNRLADGLVPAAHAPDGILEAWESEKHRFVVGVQWHPERIADRRAQRALFRAFTREAKR